MTEDKDYEPYFVFEREADGKKVLAGIYTFHKDKINEMRLNNEIVKMGYIEVIVKKCYVYKKDQ